MRFKVTSSFCRPESVRLAPVLVAKLLSTPGTGSIGFGIVLLFMWILYKASFLARDATPLALCAAVHCVSQSASHPCIWPLTGEQFVRPGRSIVENSIVDRPAMQYRHRPFNPWLGAELDNGRACTSCQRVLPIFLEWGSQPTPLSESPARHSGRAHSTSVRTGDTARRRNYGHW